MDWKTAEKEFHNSVAPIYDLSYLKGFRFFHPLVKQFLNNSKLQGAKLILDCGCGTGRAAFLADGLDFNIVCMDISIQMLKRVQRKKEEKDNNGNNKILLVVGDAEHLPFKDGCFDAVISAGLLHHLPNIPQALSEQLRVSAHKNLLIIEPANQNLFIWKKLENLVWKALSVLSKILKKFNVSSPPILGTTPNERSISGNDIEYLLNNLGLQYIIKYYLHNSIIDFLLPPSISTPFFKIVNLFNFGKYGNFFVIQVTETI